MLGIIDLLHLHTTHHMLFILMLLLLLLLMLQFLVILFIPVSRGGCGRGWHSGSYPTPTDITKRKAVGSKSRPTRVKIIQVGLSGQRLQGRAIVDGIIRGGGKITRGKWPSLKFDFQTTVSRDSVGLCGLCVVTPSSSSSSSSHTHTQATDEPVSVEVFGGGFFGPFEGVAGEVVTHEFLARRDGSFTDEITNGRCR